MRLKGSLSPFTGGYHYLLLKNISDIAGGEKPWHTGLTTTINLDFPGAIKSAYALGQPRVGEKPNLDKDTTDFKFPLLCGFQVPYSNPVNKLLSGYLQHLVLQEHRQVISTFHLVD